MQQFLCTHTFGPGQMTREQVEQFAEATQNLPEVRGIHSYVNLSEGHAACIFEAPDRDTLDKVFKKMGMPFDWIAPIEIEGSYGIMHETAQHDVSAQRSA